MWTLLSDSEVRSYAQKITTQRLDLLLNGQHSDLTIQCRNVNFKVHKSIVCPASTFFEKACSKAWKKDGQESVVSITDDSPDHIVLLLLSIYAGNFQEDYVRYTKKVIDTLAKQTSTSLSSSDFVRYVVCDCVRLTSEALRFTLADKYGCSLIKELACDRYLKALDSIAECEIGDPLRWIGVDSTDQKTCIRDSNFAKHHKHKGYTVPQDFLGSLLYMYENLPMATDSELWRTAMYHARFRLDLLNDPHLMSELGAVYHGLAWELLKDKMEIQET